MKVAFLILLSLLNSTLVNCQSKVKNIEYTIDSFNNQLFTVKDLKVKLKLKNNSVLNVNKKEKVFKYLKLALSCPTKKTFSYGKFNTVCANHLQA